jgi:ADP-heptose:LPS heptosyltransferase
VVRAPGAVSAACDYLAAIGARLDAPTLADTARIVPPTSTLAEASAREVRRPLLIVHPGAGSPAKRWAADGFAEVATWWSRAGGGVVTVAGPAEDGAKPLGGGAMVRNWPLPDLASLLARGALYLGNDSGVSHLAGAVGSVGVVLFGATDARRWRPIAGRLRVLRARAGARDAMTLESLPVRRVLAACRALVTLTTGDLDTSVPGARTNRVLKRNARPTSKMR